MASLFNELKLRGVTFRNRIGVSPMCQYSYMNGLANEWDLVHLGSRAVGGAALVIAEATAVEARGRISPGDLGIWSDRHAEALAPIVRFIEQQGAVAGIQLAHAGRKASTAVPWEGGGNVPDEQGGWETVGPSALPFADNYRTPKELTEDEIQQIQERFVDATVRARHAGFRFVELHAAHGYLAHSFLSPLSNHRKDNYGGSFDNRIRFVIQIATAMRSAWPDDLPLCVRLSCSDWAEGGWTIEESIELSRRLKSAGVDIIDCSSGGLVPYAKIEIKPGYQVPFADAIRNGADIPTAAVGLITEPQHADSIIREGKADMILMARELLRDPYWPVRAAVALGEEGRLRTPKQYLRSWPYKRS
ncbi:MAG TPA: NADH:flavin oxidoreductase/NADH oxidase [Tepidisphaeraceae bacterium]|jgi:2,4-dienoyl-CoA reductase-like NADH-dependent reductase (Old Yellow Enzyme family)